MIINFINLFIFDFLIVPRYYAAGGGVSKVAVEGVYLTEIEALQCQAPYIAEPIGGSFRCILDCSSECTAHGCIKVLHWGVYKMGQYKMGQNQSAQAKNLRKNS